MYVIDFIEEKGLDALTAELAIKVKDYQDVVVLNYDQINSPKTDPVVMECRGLILEKGTWNVLASPFKRFFNYGEAPETTTGFKFSRAVVYDKVDGSLIKIWHHPEYGWKAGTRGTAFAESDCQGHGITFCDLIYKSLLVSNGEEFDSLCNKFLDTDVTYLFELTSFENRVVTKYEGTKLWFLGAVNKNTGRTLEFGGLQEDMKNFGASLINVHGFSTMEDCLDTAASLPDLAEGYVLHDPVCDIRVKVKSPAYVAVHHIRGEGLNPKRIKQLVLLNEVDEYLLHFPEDEFHFLETIDALVCLQSQMKEVYCNFSGLESQKDFAIAVKSYVFSGILFQARSKGLTVDSSWSNLDLNQKYKVLSSFMELREKQNAM